MEGRPRDDTDLAFSVIIPVYNRADQLARCIASCRAQEMRDFEMIIVDDGSTDGTCDAYADAIDLIVLRQQNGGPAAARNSGAKVARGEYLFFLDSDDHAFPWTLASFASAIANNGKPDIVAGNFVEFRTVEPAVEWQLPKTIAYRDYLAAAEQGIYAAGGMIAVKRDVFAAVGGFDSTMKVAEDHDLMLRLGECPGFIHIVAPPTYAKHEHDGSISKVLTLFRPGCAALIAHLEAGLYGTSTRARRIARAMVGSHLRAAIITLARNGLLADSLDLYRRAFGINLRLGRLKFLAAAPIVMARRGLIRGRQ